MQKLITIPVSQRMAVSQHYGLSKSNECELLPQTSTRFHFDISHHQEDA